MAPLRPLQILLLEDNADHALLVIDCLKGENEKFQIDVCQTEAEFFQLVKQKAYDAFLVDYFTADSDGVSILAGLKKENIQAPIIFVSGHDDETIISQVLNGGASDFIIKTRSSLRTLPIIVKRSIIRKMTPQKNAWSEVSRQVTETIDDSIRKISHASQKIASGLSRGKISMADFQEISNLKDVLQKTSEVLARSQPSTSKRAVRQAPAERRAHPDVEHSRVRVGGPRK